MVNALVGAWAEQARDELRTDFLCSGTGCTSYRVEWSVQDPPEAGDLRSAATGAGWDRIDIDRPCTPPPLDTEPGPVGSRRAVAPRAHRRALTQLSNAVRSIWRLPSFVRNGALDISSCIHGISVPCERVM